MNFLQNDISGQISRNLPSGISILDNQWHNIAITKDDITVRLFIDGIKKIETQTDNSINYTDSRIWLNGGFRYDGNDSQRHGNGYVDDPTVITDLCLWKVDFKPPEIPLIQLLCADGLLTANTGFYGIDKKNNHKISLYPNG